MTIDWSMPKMELLSDLKNLAGNRLGNRCAADITGMLGVNGTLQNLSLADNQFDDNAAPLFAECLEVSLA